MIEHEIMDIHKNYMEAALNEAMKAYDLEEVPIGAVIVFDNKIIGTGYNRRNTDKNPLAHGEISAIREASLYLNDWRLEGCTMYVTLEPCPMCAGAIVQARIPTVVLGAKNLKAGSGGTLVDLFNVDAFNHKVQVIDGVLEDECSDMLKRFFKALRNKKKVERVK